MSHHSTQTLHLYRALLREANKFPVVTLRAKLRHNIRDFFELYRYETDINYIRQLLSDGERDLALLKSFDQLDTATLERLFKAHTIRAHQQ
jgi:hypothetical protein